MNCSTSERLSSVLPPIDKVQVLALGIPVPISNSLADLGAGAKPVLFGDWSRLLIRNVPGQFVVRRFDELFAAHHQFGYEMLARSDSAVMHAGGSSDQPTKALRYAEERGTGPNEISALGPGTSQNQKFERAMIGKGHPKAKENAKALRKNGAVLFFATDANMLYAREGDQWICLGHVVPVDAPRMSRPIHPKLDGDPYGDRVRLQGVKG